MKKIVYFIFYIFCFCQLGLAQKNSFGRLERVSDSIFIAENGRRYIVDRSVITVKLNPGVNEIGKELKILRSNRLGYIDLSVPEGVDIENYVSVLEKTGYFEVISYNSIGKYCVVPNDTRRSEQWYLDSINAFTAWNITMGSSNVIVAILDSGTEWTHQDIGNGTDGYSNIDATLGWNYITNNNNVITTNDHGTRVAGIVGAKTNNSRGIAGISGGNGASGVRMIPMCVGVAGPSTAIIDDAIIDAVDNGARVIQLSLEVGETPDINAAIAYAMQNNVVIVCAAGNDPNNNGLPVTYPASHADVIAVGAINQSNQRANFSNYGTNLDVVAPGVSILSTTLNNNYNSEDGTSFAAPQVAGIAALILSARPGLTQAQVRNAIESTCTKINKWSSSNPSGYTYTDDPSVHPHGEWNNDVGYGLVNAYAAVNSVVPYISGPSSVCLGVSAQFSALNFLGPVTWTCSSNLTMTSVSGNTATFFNNSDGLIIEPFLQLSSCENNSLFLESADDNPSRVIPLLKCYEPTGWIKATFMGIDVIKEVVTHSPCFCNLLLSNNGTTPSGHIKYTIFPCTSYNTESVSWSWSGIITVKDYSDSHFSFEISPSSTATITATSNTNECGTGQRSITVKPSSKSTVFYPNPVSDVLNIEIDDVLVKNTQSLATDPAFDIRLYDGLGNLLSQAKTQGGAAQLNVSNLSEGFYYLHIYDEEFNLKEQHQIVIKR